MENTQTYQRGQQQMPWAKKTGREVVMWGNCHVVHRLKWAGLVLQTEQRSWKMASRSSVHFITLCISGDVENLFAVLIQKVCWMWLHTIQKLLFFFIYCINTLQNNTVAELKEVIKRKTLIPVDEQSLYFQEQLIQDECVLSSYSGLGDGGIVYLCRRPLTLNVHSLLSDPPSELRLTVGHEVKVS